MTEPFPDRLHAAIAQRLFDEEQRRAGCEPFPLSLTTLHADLYALASALMDTISPLLAAEVAYSWAPDARPCPHMRSNDPCHNDQPHKGGPDGLGCVHWGSTWDDGHDASERRATA